MTPPLNYMAAVAAMVASSARAQPAGTPATESQPVRVAVLNLGFPRGEDGIEMGDAIGLHMLAQDFRDALPLLELDRTDVVVIRVNSLGGLGTEAPAFDEVLSRHYDPGFRTVAWVDCAYGAAARAVWGVREFYVTPSSSFGAAMDSSGVWGFPLLPNPDHESECLRMRSASLRTGRDPVIMRSMMVMGPLSADIDVLGRVTWRADALGSHVVTPDGRATTLDGAAAVRFGVARAMVSTREELARAMGLTNVEWVGRAAALIEGKHRERGGRLRAIEDALTEFQTAYGLARASRNAAERDGHVRTARAVIESIVRIKEGDPERLPLMFGMSTTGFAEWLSDLRTLVDDVARGPETAPAKPSPRR